MRNESENSEMGGPYIWHGELKALGSGQWGGGSFNEALHNERREVKPFTLNITSNFYTMI